MSESINPEDYIKVILLGESGVGKTNLIKLMIKILNLFSKN